MRITMKTTSCGPAGTKEAGKSYDVPEKEAKSLIEGGYAEVFVPAKKPSRKDDEEIETMENRQAQENTQKDMSRKSSQRVDGAKE